MSARTKRLSGVCFLLLGLLAGCGGGGLKGDQVARSPRAPSEAEATQPGAGYAGPADAAESTASRSFAPDGPAPQQATREASADVAQAPSAAPRGEAQVETARSSRPGLGTEWGETRFSRVHDVAFVRADETHPFAVTAMSYDDRAGVDALANQAWARGGSRSRETAAGNGALTVSIRGADGEPLEALHVGQRTFVIGHAGERYSIVLTNHTHHRIEAVATVDGLDVINGKPGAMHNRGYLVMPHATLEIDGFRQTQSAVAAFRFASVRDAYATQMGRSRNVGVIGVAFFDERGDRIGFDEDDRDDVRRRDTASPFPADPRFARPPRR